MLKPSCDAKTRAYKGQKNTFGLKPGNGLDGSCPCATTGCGGCWGLATGRRTSTCYVDRLQRAYPNVAMSLAANTVLMKSLTVTEMEAELTQEFDRFLKTETRRKSGLRAYRIHWSGDLFSADYAGAMTKAMSNFPELTFWIYTRSWDADLVPQALAELANVHLFASLDADNVSRGVDWITRVRRDWGAAGQRIRIAYMGTEIPAPLNEFATASAIAFFRCPVDAGTMKLEEACQNHCKFCLRDDRRILVFNT